MSSQSTVKRTAASQAVPAPAARPRTSEAATARKSRIGLWFFLAVLGMLVMVQLAGLPYFLATATERVRSPLHPWFRPSGFIGQSAGIAAFALFLFLWLYPLQKKFRRLAFKASLARWLNAHIIAGLYIPVLGTLHAAWRFTGLIGLGYGAMMVAWLSGVLGRYIYMRIPRSQNGVALTREEIENQRNAVLQQIVEATGVDAELLEHALLAGAAPTIPSDVSALRAIGVMIADDARRWRVSRQLQWTWRGASADEERSDRTARARLHDLMRHEIAIMQQARMLDVTHRLLRYWHVAHKPMAIVALAAVAIHVVTAIVLGVTWFH